jgi:DNA ligase-associated metallophosphoesterase
VRLTVRGEQFELLPERALFWPSRRLLVVADCHLGKAETFQQQGFWLPSRSQDLDRLSALAGRVGAKEVLFLGDLVHTLSGVTEAVVEAFARWLGEFDGSVRIVLGNHDAGLAKRWPAQWRRADVCERLDVERFRFQHQLADGQAEAELFYWVGHVHPMIRMERGPDRLRLPAFVIGTSQGLLPAFSSMSGGYDISPLAEERVFVIGEGLVYEI